MFDPTGQFAVVPDLGCDRIRIYRVPGGGKPELKHTGVARVKQGSGPRHGAFAVGSDRTYLYILTELSNEIIGFKVHYRSGTMKLQKIFSTGIHGKKPAPEGASASEIIVTVCALFSPLAKKRRSWLTTTRGVTSRTTSL